LIAANDKVRRDFLAGTGEMGARIRALDWSRTPLGPIEAWPQSLKTSVSLILNSRHPMWIGWGPQMTFLYNDAYLHVLGSAKHRRALGRPASEVWAEIWDVCGPLADKVFEQGEATFVDDVRLFMNRGDFREETFYSFSYSPIRDESGQVCGLFCPSTDVTPKVINTRRLRTLSELATNALAEKTTVGACATAARTLSKNPDDIPFALLYLADAAGKFAMLEQAVGGFESGRAIVDKIALEPGVEASPWPIGKVFRTAQREILSVKNVSGLPLGVADQPVSEAVVLAVTSRGEHKPYGVLIIGVNPGRPLDVEHLTFFELVAGQVATAIQNAREVEEEKRRADMLAEIDRAKTVFFSNVSHEFRTPLTLMLGPLETLLEHRDRLLPEDHEHLEIAHRSSLRLLKLVNSLLDFSRIEAGRTKASYAPADLAASTSELASNFRSAMDAAGLKLVVDCPPLPEPVYVDPEMWEKIVLNLLSNAFKFTFEGSVAVRLRPVEGGAALTVADTGIGIPEEELPRIFERFHRIEGARGRTYEGTGIGLALVQELVKLHGGSIAVASQIGEGSTFTVTLPWGSAHLPQDRLGLDAVRGISTAVRAEAFTGEAMTWLPGSTAPAETEPQPGKRRILLADDNADMREHVSRILGKDYHLTVAEDGRQAWERIRKDPPDLLLTDVMMPGMGGFELLRAVRGDARTQMLPVILVSARAGEGMRVEGLEAGADDYLIKPFTANELRARVGTHLEMARSRRRALEREAELRAEAEAARDQAVSVLESITDGFLALDRDWRVTYNNAEAERLNRMGREETLGRNFWELFPQAIGTPLHQELLRAAADRVPVEFENYYAPWKRWFYIKAYPASDGGLSLFYKDITVRKGAEGAIQLLGAIVDSSDDAIISKDLNGIITTWNKGAEHLFGYSTQEAVGQSVTLLIPGDRLNEEIDILSRIKRGERVDHFETIRRRKDGSLLDISLTISPVKNVQGIIIGASKIARDISDRKRAERAIQGLNAQLTAELSAMRRMQQISSRLVQAGDFDQLLGEIVDAGLEITGSDMGNIQLLEDGILKIVSHRGLEAPFLEFFAQVHGGQAACGAAMNLGERVIVEDVMESPLFAGASREVMLAAGARAVQATPLASRSGQILGMFSTHYRTPRKPADRELRLLDVLARQAADLIERKRAEAELLLSEARFRQLADAMPQIVWTARPDGFLDYYNERWYEFTGFSRERLGDISWQPVLHPDDLKRCYDAWYVSVQSGQPFNVELRFWDRFERRWRWFMGRALPVLGKDGRIVKWFGTSTDIDDQKRVEAELRRANQDLEQFAYSASHDLQEPLRSIKIYGELLADRYGGKLDGQALEFLDYLRIGASRMEVLVRDLLTYTQVTRLDVPAEAADANEALAATLANLAGAIAESGASVTSDPLPAVRVHDTHLRQLFQNLLGNAIKYRSPERPPVVHVSAELQHESGSWVFTVSDNGIGIAPEYKEHIFGLFKRLHTSDEYSGTGIGLAICQRIVERYNGRIWVESELGEGSRFIVALPI
jgi:PAS domain S-box-containing protein